MPFMIFPSAYSAYSAVSFWTIWFQLSQVRISPFHRAAFVYLVYFVVPLREITRLRQQQIPCQLA